MATTNPKNKIANHNPDLSLLLDEDTINLDKHSVLQATAEAAVKSCKTYLKMGGLDLEGEKLKYDIPRRSFVTLFKEAARLPVRGNFVCAVKIFLGYDARAGIKNFCFVYIPVRLNKGARVGASNTFIYAVLEQGNPFKYNPVTNDFIQISEEEKNALTEGYKANVTIKRTDDPADTHTIFQNGDTEAATFSFQEIFAIMYDNNPNPLDQDIFKGSEMEPITIRHCVHSDTMKKHSLILSPNLPILDFSKMYGNLAHLCPPHCKGGDFNYELD